MHTTTRRGRVMLAGLALTTTTAGTAAAHPIHLPAVEAVHLVVDGVDNPRGLTFDTSGSLYIAASGDGGTDACTSNEQGYFCSGLSGAVLRVDAGQLAQASLASVTPSVVADGLVSMAYPNGTFAHGVHDVAADRHGTVHAVFMGTELIGAAGSESCCQPSVQGDLRDAALAQLGNLVAIHKGNLEVVADVDHWEYTNNPIAGPTSNPYALDVDRDGSFIVADAAANVLLRVNRKGEVSLVTVFDNIRPGDENTGVEAVPSGVAVGPDGNYYVSLLAGFHPGFGRIVQVTPAGVQRIVADGLSMPLGVAVSAAGTIYSPEFSGGDLVRVRRDPDRSGRWLAPDHLYRGALTAPAGIAIGPKGDIYISDAGPFTDDTPFATGRVVRVAG